MISIDYLEHHGIKGQKWGIRRTQEQLGHVKTNNPVVRKLNNYRGKLYFISEQKLDNKTLYPRVPDNFFTKNGYEDNTTKRVCFASSINQCLQGMSYNVKGKTFYVYEPSEKHDVYQPNSAAVPDSTITGELWIKDPVKIKRIGTVKCTGDTGSEGHKFTYGNGKIAELYDWDYEWMDTV